MGNIISFLNRYKLQLGFTLVILTILSGILWGFLFPPPPDVKQTDQVNNAAGPSVQPSSTANGVAEPSPTPEEILQKTEAISPDHTRYIYQSSNPDRPNERIASEDGELVFEREVFPQDENPPTISDYLDANGEPEAVVQGSKFYGPSAVTYIYASKGLAFIGDENNNVVELHTFPATTVENYKANPENDILENNDD